MSIKSEALELNSKRKKWAAKRDIKTNNKIMRLPTEENFKVWKSNPGASDIIGVDGEGAPTLKRDKQLGAPTKPIAPKRTKAAAATVKKARKPPVISTAQYEFIRPEELEWMVQCRKASGPANDYAFEVLESVSKEIDAKLSIKFVERAYYANSFTPDKRARQRRREAWQVVYDLVSTVLYPYYLGGQDQEGARPYYVEQESKFSSWTVRYIGTTAEWIAAIGRGANSMVVGPANFNARRQEKSRNAERKRMNAVVEIYKKGQSIAEGFNYEAHKREVELKQKRVDTAKGQGLQSKTVEMEMGTWEFNVDTMRVNFTPSSMLDVDMRNKLKRTPYAMKWSPRYKMYTRQIVPTAFGSMAFFRALERDFGFVVGAEPTKAKKDVPGTAIDNISPEKRQEISLKLDELVRLTSEAKSKGESAPNYNLCDISIPGTNIYCAGNKGIPREEMPQFKGKPLPGTPAASLPLNRDGEVDTEPLFRKMLAEKNIKVTSESVYSDSLKSTQSELVGSKVAGMTKALEADPKNPAITAPIFISKDDYVIDGHHRWAAVTSYAIKQGMPAKMDVERIDLPIGEAIRMANDFAQQMGIAVKKGSVEPEAAPTPAPPVEPQATPERTRGYTERKRLKTLLPGEETMPSSEPATAPQPEAVLSGAPTFYVSNMSEEEVNKRLSSIEFFAKAYKDKALGMKESFFAIASAWSAITNAMSEEDKLDGRNIAAFIKMNMKMARPVRAYYPLDPPPIVVNSQGGPFFLVADQVTNPEALSEMLNGAVSSMSQKSFGKILQNISEKDMDVEAAMKILDPIAKNFLGKDKYRPAMSGINFDQYGRAAMTNAHILLTLEFPKFTPDFPYVRQVAIPDSVPLKLVADLDNKQILSIDEQKRQAKGFPEAGDTGIILAPITPVDKTFTPYQQIESKYPNYKFLIDEADRHELIMTLSQPSIGSLYRRVKVLSEVFPSDKPKVQITIQGDNSDKRAICMYDADYLLAALATVIYFGPDKIEMSIGNELNPNKQMQIKMLSNFYKRR